MDQLKQQLAVALKHVFWIGSGLVLLGSVAVWYLTTTGLEKEIQTQTSKIKSNDSAVKTVRNEMSDQPNDFSHEKMENLIDARKAEVLEAWKTVFEAQRDILTWPQELKSDFIDRFKYVRTEDGKIDRSTLKLPVEKYVEYPVQDSELVPQTILDRYARYIGKVLPDYAAIAKAEWTAEFDQKSGGRGGAGGYDEMSMGMGMGTLGRPTADTGPESLVKWSQSSQESVLLDLFPWKGKTPSTLDVYYSQENLWILNQLLSIIATVNGDAQQPFEAKIREIKRIAIGNKSVQFGQGNVSKPGSLATGGMGSYGGMEDMMMGGMDGMDMYTEGSEMGGGFSMEDAPDPGEERYVNTEMEPIGGSDLRSAFASEDPGQVALAVAKRLPVMMKLQMDQRAVSDLIAACGNAPLMVEVKQVRELPKGSAAEAGGDGGDGMGAMMEEPMDMGMGMGDGNSMGGGPPKEPDDFPLDMDVEIYGLIYFYNPPNEEALGIDKVVDDVEIDSSASGSTDLPAPAAAGTAPNATDPSATVDPAAVDPTATPPADPTAPQPGTPPATTPPATTPPATSPPATTPPAADPAAATGPPAALSSPVGNP